MKVCRIRGTIGRGYSTKAVREIKPSRYGDVPAAHMVRKGLKDTTYLPQTGRNLLANDPLCINFNNLVIHSRHHVDPRVDALVQHIGDKLPVLSWSRFYSLYMENPRLLSSFTKAQCAALLNLTASAPTKPPVTWERLQTVVGAIRNGGYGLSAQEYARLIKSAFRARDFESVDLLWREVEEQNIEKTTGLWNAYIWASCNCDVNTWPGYTLKPQPQPGTVNDPVALFKDLCQEGCVPNSETYELLLLGFAQQRDLDGVRTVTSSIWGRLGDDAHQSKQYHLARYGSMVQPTLSTLTTLIHAYGFNGAMIEGLEYVDWLQRKYSINLSTAAATKFWNAALKWTFRTAKPGGTTPRYTFETLWESMTMVYNITPTPYMFNLRLMYLNSRRQSHKLMREMRWIESIPDLRNKDHILATYLNRTCRSLVRRSLKKRALKLMHEYGHKSEKLEQTRRRLLLFMEQSKVPALARGKRLYRERQRYLRIEARNKQAKEEFNPRGRTKPKKRRIQ
jgi:hypothetical protein